MKPALNRLAPDRRLLRFAIVGVANTAITVVSYAILIEIGVPYPLAGFISYSLGILNGYTWNRVWTFETGRFHGPEFARYIAIQVSAALANAGGLAFAVEVLGLGKLIAEVCVLVPLVLATYAINRSWTFRPR